MSDKVSDLGIKRKPPPGESRTLIPVYTRECSHRGPYVVDESLAQVECATCHARLDPLWVLMRLANKETQMETHRAAYQDEMRRLAERSKTKCQCCGKMTRISRA